MAASLTINPGFMVRAAQSVTHRTIPDRTEADRLGRQIADFALAHWEAVRRRYGSDGADELEIVERLARDTLSLRAEVAAQVIIGSSLPRF